MVLKWQDPVYSYRKQLWYTVDENEIIKGVREWLLNNK